MAIASYKPNQTPAVQPNLPKTQPTNYKSIIYDDKNVPLASLAAYASGSPYYCDYYKQVVSEHNDLREIDPGQPAIFQQYEKINGLEIRVSAPLDTAYDSSTGITTVTGSGLIYPFMVPNVMDYFVSDADDSRKGLFKITNVERKTFNRDSAFSIEYEMVGYIDALDGLYDDLVSKVIREYHFSKDRLIENLQPILKTDDYQKITSLKDWYREIVQYYFSTFFNRRYMTLVIPGQEYAVYDQFLVDYLLKIVDSFDAYELRLMKQFNMDGDPYGRQPQFWEMMLQRQFGMLPNCNREMALVSKHAFNPSSFIHGIYFSNIDYIIYPKAPNETTNVGDLPVPKSPSSIELQETPTAYGTVADLLNHTFANGTAVHQLYYNVLVDSSYVLSNAFYTQSTSMSVLEILTKDYLKQQTLNLSMLLALCEHYYGLGRLEQFYYAPILLTLIKEADRGTYT